MWEADIELSDISFQLILPRKHKVVWALNSLWVYWSLFARQTSDISPADASPESKMAVPSVQMLGGWLVCLNWMSTDAEGALVDAEYNRCWGVTSYLSHQPGNDNLTEELFKNANFCTASAGHLVMK